MSLHAQYDGHHRCLCSVCTTTLCGRYLAIILSVTAILFFGEIFPQAVCTGDRRLSIAAFFVPLTRFLMIIFYVAAWPVAKAIDYFLGEDRMQLFRRCVLRCVFVCLHASCFVWRAPTHVGWSVLVAGHVCDVSATTRSELKKLVELHHVEAEDLAA